MAAAVNRRALSWLRDGEFTRGDGQPLAVAKALAREGDQARAARAMRSLTVMRQIAPPSPRARGAHEQRDQNRAARAMETFSRGKADAASRSPGDGVASRQHGERQGRDGDAGRAAALGGASASDQDTFSVFTHYAVTRRSAHILSYIKPGTARRLSTRSSRSGRRRGRWPSGPRRRWRSLAVPNQTAIARPVASWRWWRS